MLVEKKWILRESTDPETVGQLSSELGVDPVLAELLVLRGVKTFSQARSFFRPSLDNLYDPFLMTDMDKAVERVRQAVTGSEKILVYGDYDVDGTTAVALVYRFLQQFTTNIDYYIPNRDNDGYGVSFTGVEYAKQTGVKLVIVLDCGVKAVNEIAYAKELGIDFIVCDHHMQDEVLPPAVAILNPKLSGSNYPYPHLSGCGVGFKLMQAFAKDNGIEGVVSVVFTVKADGSIGNIKIKRMIDPDLESEAIRLVKQMPAWTPANDNGTPVESTAETEISFSLD